MKTQILTILLFLSFIGSASSQCAAWNYSVNSITFNSTTNKYDYSINFSYPMQGNFSAQIEAYCGSTNPSDLIDTLACTGSLGGTNSYTWNFSNLEGCNSQDIIIKIYKFKNVSCGPPCDIAFNQTLPVILKDFSVIVSQGKLSFNWETETEINTDKYVIDESLDGTNYHNVLSAKANNVESASTYQEYTDLESRNGIHYFRLSSFDFDGFQHILKTVSLDLGSRDGFVSIYPNPTSGKLYVLSNDSSEIQNIKIYDSTGILIFETNEYDKLDISELNCGLYLIKITSNSGEEYLSRVVKQ
ncbi:MAG TPA: T9SS type A sorting domain-containing protein [Saprospiraceae bacterium]|nr:T9SS type A sorting domain-containing protein [Saprospiraceae bacterium]MCB9327304.1 T9SS type A sorting domain-containing protein [Lewinellaceae bacterium]HPQ20505.1 T9SS type A sorting domain-containing protein [Saprospiraceae bacterium]HRX28721.1 T9SS type A sorting domain-containing protein [Saprospiraceae bacterium]